MSLTDTYTGVVQLFFNAAGLAGEPAATVPDLDRPTLGRRRVTGTLGPNGSANTSPLQSLHLLVGARRRDRGKVQMRDGDLPRCLRTGWGWRSSTRTSRSA